MSVLGKSLAGRGAIVGFILVCGVVESIAQAPGKAVKDGKAAPAKVPAVALSKAHQALCKVKVGDTMPDMALPRLESNETAKLSSLFGKKATVLVLWKGDRRMAREQLADMGPEVAEPFTKAEVAVVGVAVTMPPADVQAALKAAGADFPNLLDSDGQAFAKIGTEKLPRTYLIDPQGRILWFDIEYSLGTRRELNQALRAVAGEPASAGGPTAKQQ
jgi:peroxiredoxin